MEFCRSDAQSSAVFDASNTSANHIHTLSRPSFTYSNASNGTEDDVPEEGDEEFLNVSTRLILIFRYHSSVKLGSYIDYWRES
jgi:hypothetical protein